MSDNRFAAFKEAAKLALDDPKPEQYDVSGFSPERRAELEREAVQRCMQTEAGRAFIARHIIMKFN